MSPTVREPAGSCRSCARSGLPDRGSPSALRSGDALGGQPSLLLLGQAQSSTPFGVSGCSLLVATVAGPPLLLPLAGAGPGKGAVTLAGATPATAPRLTVTMRAFLGDPGAPGGFTSTNGLITVYPQANASHVRHAREPALQ